MEQLLGTSLTTVKMQRGEVNPSPLLQDDVQRSLEEGAIDLGDEQPIYAADTTKDKAFAGMVGGSTGCVGCLALILFPIALFTGFVWWILFVLSSILSLAVMFLLIIPKKIEITDSQLRIATYVPKLVYKTSLRNITSVEQVSPFTDASSFRAITAPLVTTNKNVLLVRSSGRCDFLLSPDQHNEFMAQLRAAVDKRKFGEP